jgi:hypothetical protein
MVTDAAKNAQNDLASRFLNDTPAGKAMAGLANDRTTANGNVVSGEIGQAACRARENLVGFMRIRRYDASTQNHLRRARGAPHGRKFQTPQKVFCTA